MRRRPSFAWHTCAPLLGCAETAANPVISARSLLRLVIISMYPVVIEERRRSVGMVGGREDIAKRFSVEIR